MYEQKSQSPVLNGGQTEPQEAELKNIIMNMRNAVGNQLNFLSSVEVYANALSPLPTQGGEKQDPQPTQGGATGVLWEILADMNRIQNRLQYLNDHFYKVIGN